MAPTTQTPILTPNPSRTCRICLDSDNPEDLISPCLCTGGSAYVHRKCLDNWRAMNKFGRAFNTCEVCQFEYVYEEIVDDPAADKKRLWIFRLFVTRDVSLILILFQAIIVGLAFLLQYADKNSYTIRNYYPHSMSSFGVYYLSSLILFFALLAIFGMIGACCGLLSDSETRTGGCACYYCYCAPVDCNCGGNQNCNGNSNVGEGIVIVILVLAVIGVLVGIVISVMIFRKIMKRHTNRLWLRQETKKYIVKDFQGRTHELRNLPAQRSVPAYISLQNQGFNQQTQTNPSAPPAPLPTISKTID